MASVTSSTIFLKLAYLSLPLIWVGILIGVSLLATPVKFQATSLSLSVALDVGRVTFSLLNKVEWCMSTLLILVWLLQPKSYVISLLLLTLFLIIALQSFWLLPRLGARVAAVIAGTPQPPSLDHALYALAEGVKLVALLSIGLTSLWKLAQG